MPESIMYKRLEIETNCQELDDDAGWPVFYNIVMHYGDRVHVQPFYPDGRKPSLEEAQQAATALAKRHIDSLLT